MWLGIIVDHWIFFFSKSLTSLSYIETYMYNLLVFRVHCSLNKKNETYLINLVDPIAYLVISCDTTMLFCKNWRWNQEANWNIANVFLGPSFKREREKKNIKELFLVKRTKLGVCRLFYRPSARFLGSSIQPLFWYKPGIISNTGLTNYHIC